ncbi:MAG: hypothetical protein ACRDRV_17220 [Pseudonocardiaceae bacterium]
MLIGAFFTQLSVLDTPVPAITPAVLGVLLALIAWCRRPQRAPGS